MPSHLKIEIKEAPAYEEIAIMRVMEEEEDWRSPIARFILMGELPNDGVEARKIKIRSYKFHMIQGELYKRSHLGPLLFCMARRNIDQVLYEVHEGEVCGHHVKWQSLAFKITRAGYFWPTLMNDARNT
ncbi:hypothetical protein LIER_18059 [Lithospermum erythrorhizon]|uniref:Integrase zinc-binding domain-containing protein n=1 Tax=Lithospermum erythrorhizon TaxID=34254 RepID=A0AAV3QI47_LITER